MILLVALLLLAQADGSPDLPRPPPRQEVDASPTSFACTFTSALRGDTCVYEAEPHAVKDAKANIRLAADQAARVCAADAETKAQRKSCVDLTARAAEERCSGDGRGLADEQGRLTRAAEPCAIALRQVIVRTTGRAVESTGPAQGVNAPPKNAVTPRKTSIPEKI